MKRTLATIFLFVFGFLHAQTPVLSTDFQQGIPANYSLLNNDNQPVNAAVSEFTSAWIVVADPENPLDSVAAATSYFTSADTADRWLITPQLALGGFGNYVTWNAKSHDPSFPDDYLVLVSHTDMQPSSFTDTIGHVQQENFEWTNREVNLSSQGYNDSLIYIAFVLRTYDGFKLYLDDIEVRKEDPVGLSEPIPLPFQLYPNPCSDLIRIASTSPLQRIEISDLNGQVLLQSTSPELEVSFLPKGFYLVRIQSESKTYTQRFTKI
jgi:hypothetical protein